jgi:hypothetical protein
VTMCIRSAVFIALRFGLGPLNMSFCYSHFDFLPDIFNGPNPNRRAIDIDECTYIVTTTKSPRKTVVLSADYTKILNVKEDFNRAVLKSEVAVTLHGFNHSTLPSLFKKTHSCTFYNIHVFMFMTYKLQY